ncbi:MAG: AEC family transporter [Chloroflexi bacterium]|nr:MAG: AEC family transporter [Chloroflexota bacterium]
MADSGLRNAVNITAVLIDVILPVFVIIGVGALTGRWLGLNVQTLSRSVLYIFGPALVFRSLLTTELSAQDAGQIVAFYLVTSVVMGVIAWGMTRALRFDAVQSNAFLLTTLLINTGNYGLPVNLFAFGNPGLERAIIFFATASVLTNTVGIYIAARGHAEPRQALRNVFRLPLIYAVAVALVLRVAGITSLPHVLFRPIDLLADAAVPVLLLALGIELSRTTFDRELWAVGLATAMRLVVAAVVAGVIATLMGLQGLTRQVCIVEASMPTAVMSVVLAVEFDTRPRFVTSVVFISTLASLVTLTILLSVITR